MSDNVTKILLVDDQQENINILGDILRSQYKFMTAVSESEALNVIEDCLPDLIFIDAMVPEIDGYEICKKIKSSPDAQDIDVIFISSTDSEEEILTAYNAGASDYLTKPIRPVEVLQKVNLAINNRALRKSLQEEKQQATQTAMHAITTSGEQGVVIDFMRQSFLVGTIDALAQLVIRTIKSYGYESSIQIRTEGLPYNVTSTEPISPLEEEFLTKAQEVDRLKDVGRHFIVNYKMITILVKNMPEDEEKRGRLRDHFAIIAEGSESRLNSLLVTESINNTLLDVQQSLSEIELFQRHNKQASIKIVEKLSDTVKASFLSYGLTEDQEEILVEAMTNAEEKMALNFSEGHLIDDRLSRIVLRLQECYELATRQHNHVDESPEQEDDIELF